MKLCNAPERKRERQLGALERRQKQLDTKSYKGFRPSETARNKKLIEKEIKVLEKRTASSRRDIRTKKRRSV